MGSCATAVGVGVVVFASTNVDDLFVLTAFFADRRMAGRWVVAGQFAGIGTLVLVSAVVALLALAAPEGWLGLLGLAPLSIGVFKLWALLRGDSPGRDDEGAERAVSSRVRADGWQAQLLSVSGVTIANGGDNLGVYIPLFASDLRAVWVYAVVFAVMTAAWCLAAHALVHSPLVARHIRRYGHIALPFVLIGLGLHILSGSLALPV